MKPYKIRLSSGDLRAQGMYILLGDGEEKYTKLGITSPPNRIYKIEIAVEVIFNGRRCRGKRSFNIPKGTSIIKAVESLIVKKDEMIRTLKDRGSLKVEKIVIDKADSNSRILNDLFDIWIAKKKINKKPNTVRVYSVYYNAHIRNSIGKKNIYDINEDNIQLEVINKMINSGLNGNTIKGIKRILKPLFEENDKILNWKKIELPLPPKPRKYYKSKEDTVKIVKALNSYYHPVARAVFKFLLTGRRVNEILYLEHENIDYKNMKFKILAKYAKTNKDFEFPLTQVLIDAIKEQVEEKKIDLIIMGTKGASGFSEVVIGTNTGDLITKIKCPVLIIPENSTFIAPKEIAFPTDFYNFYQPVILNTISDFAEMYNSSVRIVHIAKKDEIVTEHQLENKHYLHNYFTEEKHSFHKITNNSIEEGIRCFVESRDIDIIIMVAKNLTFFQRILFKPTVEEISFHTKVPFLVLHEEE